MVKIGDESKMAFQVISLRAEDRFTADRRASAGSGGATPGSSVPTMGGRLDRTCGERPLYRSRSATMKLRWPSAFAEFPTLDRDVNELLEPPAPWISRTDPEFAQLALPRIQEDYLAATHHARRDNKVAAVTLVLCVVPA